MADIIMDPWTPSAARYPEEEWTWRGIVDPALVGGDLCAPSGGELIYNWTFDCGLDGWQIYAGTTGTLTDNADGTISLQALDEYASMEPINFPVTNNTDTYILTVVVTALTGNAKISIMIDTTWTSTKFTTPGTYTQEFTGNLTEMVVGADNDASATLTYDSLSVKKKVAERVTYNGIPVTHEGEQVTWQN